MAETGDIVLSVQPRGALGLITLNRPKALNALTWPMLRAIDAALTAWEADPAIRAIAFIGAGDRAFCAGGDVKAAWQAGMALKRGEAGAQSPAGFFRDEYRLNRRLFHYPKPLIALMNGIVMGGGYGLAGQCRYRIACPQTTFAMPEVGIGFFPDVGSAWHLARMPDRSGFYLGITGATIGAADMAFTGVATHVLPYEDLLDVPRQLDNILAEKGDIESVLKVSENEENSLIKAHKDLIKNIFSETSISKIMDGLTLEGSRCASQTADLLARRSPTSLNVALNHLLFASAESFDTVIDRDFQLAQRFMQDSDFYEGVRAALIDRDGKPVWHPATLQDVKEESIGAFFASQGRTLDDIAT